MPNTSLADLLTALTNRPDSYATVSVNTTRRLFTPNQIKAILSGSTVPLDEYLLNVPYYSQESADAKRYRNDCGPACIRMLMVYYFQPDATVDVLSNETGLRTADVGLTTQALVNLGNAHGLKLALTSQANPGFIRNEIAAGRPVIPLISYAPLINRLNTADTQGHFVVVTGYDGTSYFVNDPDWYTKGDRTAEDGHHWRIPKDQFEKALAVSPVPYQAVIIAPSVMPPTNYAQGIDISRYQTITDMALLRRSYDFIIMKATEGLKYDDPTFATRRSALQGGPRLGAYHFGTGADPVQQARHFVNTVKPDGNIALFLDFELNPDQSTASEGSMTAAQAEIFIDEVERLTGKVCGMYTRANLVPAGNWRFRRVPLWVASYNANPTISPLWATWSIQQYNNGATGPAPYTIQGVAGTGDHDRYNGDANALAAFWPSICGTILIAPPPPPPQWVNRYVVSPFRLGINIHTAPGLDTPVKTGGYPNNTPVKVNLASLTSGYVQDEAGGWVALQYLSETAIPSPDPTPVPVPTPGDAPNVPPSATRIGLHIGSNAPGGALVEMCKRLDKLGKHFGAMTVITDPGLANALAPYTTVMFRMVWGDYELYDEGHMDGMTPAQAEQYGHDFYFAQHHDSTVKASAAQYIKLVNERGFHAVVGNDFWIGAMKAADADKRKLAIYGDSFSSVTPDKWLERLPSLRYAMAHGHAVTVNAYGRTTSSGTGGNFPVSDPEGFQWFGGWPMALYNAAPTDARPLLIIGETGSSDSTVKRAFNPAEDAAAYDKLLRPYPYIKGFCYYTIGTWYGHADATLDYALADFEAAVAKA